MLHLDPRIAVGGLVVGIPGVLAGARLSARTESRLVGPALLLALASTGLKLLVQEDTP